MLLAGEREDSKAQLDEILTGYEDFMTSTRANSSWSRRLRTLR